MKLSHEPMAQPCGFAAAMHDRRRLCRAAFSEIELVVCIGVIVLLLAVIVPTLMKARGLAHGAQCKDHLHNLGVAVENYLHNSGSYPVGATPTRVLLANGRTLEEWSWMVDLLPYVEQSPLHDSMRAVQHPNRGTAASGGFTGLEWQQVHIDVFTCLQDEIGRDGQTPAPASYAACYHHDEATITAERHGLFVRQRALRPVDVRDGLAYTLAIGDKQARPDDMGWFAGDQTTLRNAGFVLNAERRAQETNGDIRTPVVGDIGGFSSHHPGGVNFLFADTSVRFLSEQVDHMVLRRLADRFDGELVELPKGPVDPDN
ncbi:MAG: DUF1559 domain-containing protein [Planctomycetaceae bacterium]